MGLDGMEAFEIQHRLEIAVGGRIAVDGRNDVGAEGWADRGVLLERGGVGLPDLLAGYVKMIEPLGNAVDDGPPQRVVMQDGRVDEARQLRLTPDDVLRFATDPAPH